MSHQHLAVESRQLHYWLIFSLPKEKNKGNYRDPPLARTQSKTEEAEAVSGLCVSIIMTRQDPLIQQTTKPFQLVEVVHHFHYLSTSNKPKKKKVAKKNKKKREKIEKKNWKDLLQHHKSTPPPLCKHSWNSSCMAVPGNSWANSWGP